METVEPDLLAAVTSRAVELEFESNAVKQCHRMLALPEQERLELQLTAAERRSDTEQCVAGH